jgi:enhancer of polycomb-like protein
MATRTSIRPRPVDVQKQLVIVRNLEDLDSTDGIREAELVRPAPDRSAPRRGARCGRDQRPAGASPAAPRHAPQAHEAKKKHGKDIPVPDIGRVPTYHRDYLPVFDKPHTYIHGRGRPPPPGRPGQATWQLPPLLPAAARGRRSAPA